MRRVFVIVVLVYLFVVVLLFHTAIKDSLWAHPWWQSTLAAIPTIALVVIGVIDLRGSEKANELRLEANQLRGEANKIRVEANELRARVANLEAERNQHLQQIAANTKRETTQAERNAATLRKHLREQVSVTEGDSRWGNPPTIAEVGEDNVVTFFIPRGFTASNAFAVMANCSDLEITEIPDGSNQLRIKILKRYGEPVQLGELTKWEDRLQKSPSSVAFPKGPNGHRTTYSKTGSSEVRSFNIYQASDGSNSFLLEASDGTSATGDNVEISKQFMLRQVEYQAAGFIRSTDSSGSVSPPLYINL